MKNFLVLFLLCSFSCFCQEEDMGDTRTPRFQELGIDGHFSAGTNGGIIELGLKYGFKFGVEKNFIAGPAFRIQRFWSNQFGQKFSYNIIGLGAFFHARFYNALFLGGELEFLNAPIQYNLVSPPKQFIPVLFVGGGYSQEFNEKLRLNVGIFYDVINNINSPYRPYYKTKTEQNIPIPITYRVALFIPI